jgi:hypothetical protein
MTKKKIELPKFVVGRPTKYKEEYCQVIIDLASEGALPIIWASKLMVAKQTLHDWRKSYPKFSYAYDVAKSLAEAHLSNRGLHGDPLDLNKAKFFLSASFNVSEVNKREVKQEINTMPELKVSFGDREE